MVLFFLLLFILFYIIHGIEVFFQINPPLVFLAFRFVLILLILIFYLSLIILLNKLFFHLHSSIFYIILLIG